MNTLKERNENKNLKLDVDFFGQFGLDLFHIITSSKVNSAKFSLFPGKWTRKLVDMTSKESEPKE